MSRTGTSPATLADAFALNQGLNRAGTSPATLGDTFALSQGLNRAGTSPATLGDTFALNQLEVKLIVGETSDDDMWFAYDTTTYDSKLEIP